MHSFYHFQIMAQLRADSYVITIIYIYSCIAQNEPTKNSFSKNYFVNISFHIYKKGFDLFRESSISYYVYLEISIQVLCTISHHHLSTIRLFLSLHEGKYGIWCILKKAKLLWPKDEYLQLKTNNNLSSFKSALSITFY